MFVCGIDPGLSRCGYAVLRTGTSPDRAPEATALGVLRTSPTDPPATRLAELAGEMRALLAEFRPPFVAVERVFFQANARTAVSVAQAMGVVLAEAAAAGATVVEYTPNEVKQAVAGWGGADKSEIQRMVQVRLGLARLPEPADAADAAAVALCYLARAPLAARLSGHLTGERA